MNDVYVKLQSYDKLHIDIHVVDPVSDAVLWRFTGFYGESKRELQYRSWECLHYLNSQSSAPWLCAGDFNEILDAREQFGGVTRPERQMEGFRDVVDACGFWDLGFLGLPYTWDNRQQGAQNIKVRLDRAFANQAFADLFNIRVRHVQTTESDHCCLIIECNRSRRRRSRNRGFKYENMWRRHPAYGRLVEETWRGGGTVHSLSELQGSLRKMQAAFHEWDHSVFGSVRKELMRLRHDLEVVRRQSLLIGPSRSKRRIMARISELLSWEETMEKQRSRITWLKEGDRNTKFFQAKSKERNKTNRISGLRTSDGGMVTEQDQIEAMASEFYASLFTAQVDSAPEEILPHVPVRVTAGMNEVLEAPYTAQEVENALFMMGANKAPGPDGFTAGFFQTHWDLVGPSVTNAVLNFLEGREMPDDMNQTTIVLIPKIKNPHDLKNYRPISLCNVVYKICSKVLANRFRGFLDEIISQEQSAFVPGRLITDNVLVAYECTHYLKRKKGKSGACAIKLDMMKAYDRVEWNYLQGIMLKLGFADSFVNTVMRCVRSVKFSVRVNGSLSQPFVPSRGIRQGDPISPYLFLLCSEGLTCLLKAIGPLHLSRGVRVGVHAPWVSHLLFADDCIVFSEASRRGAERLQDVLDRYSRGSGQLVNKEKSAVFFSSNCSDEAKHEVRNVLQIETEALAEKYLGLPTALGRSSKEAFEYMPSRIRGLIGSWSGREASCAGREVLLKSVAQAVPTYPMSCFLVPKGTCKKMRTVISNYWWGSSADNRHMHWQKWELLTRPKVQGGMGFRDLHLFNRAMLGKQGWRLLEKPDSLCARVLKGRYFHDTDFLSATRKRHASHTWRAILDAREVLRLGLIRRIGDGNSTDI